MAIWRIQGAPVAWGGEAPERVWRKAIRDQSPTPEGSGLNDIGNSKSACLSFHVLPRQVVGMPDLDNLMVPVIEELRNKGWFSRGFPSLDHLTLRKTGPSDELGVSVEIQPAGPQGERKYQVVVPTRIKEGNAASTEAVRSSLHSYLSHNGIQPIPFGEAVRLTIRYRQRRLTSIVSMLKTTIDGLEPLLGRPETANPRSRFFPSDERVVEISALRQQADVDEVSLGWASSVCR